MSESFMSKYKKNLQKNRKGVTIGLLPPQYYLHTGSYLLNKLMSDNFLGGSPQGRIVAFAGHSSSGKSLVAASHVAAVIAEGGMALVVDTEGALDERYMRRCGVDVDSPTYMRVGVSNIDECTGSVADFIKDYKENNLDTKAVILIDSLDNLFTASEEKNYETKGEIGGDQGQQAKQLKRALKPFTNTITSENITVICTKQVYKQQDPIKALSEPWVFTPALEYAFSQIIIFEKLLFKDMENGKNVHKGFTMKARSYKNRFAQEKQEVKVEVPYDQGMDPYAGLLDVAVDYGVVTKAGAWYTFGDKKWQGRAGFRDYAEEILEKIIEADTTEVDGKVIPREVNVSFDDYVSAYDGNENESARAKKKRLLEESATDKEETTVDDE